MNSISHKLIRQSVLALWLVTPAMVRAELTVIYDNGHTRPVAPLMRSLKPAEDSTNENAKEEITRPLLGAAAFESLLPLASPGLTPALLHKKSHPESIRERLNLVNGRPLFLIGADSLSYYWLERNRERLKRMGAVGMLVQANTVDEVRHIAALAKGLPIMPGIAGDIASELGIVHYPVLITKDTISQ